MNLAGATNDRAGSVALVPGLTVMLADKGSSISADGKTLQVTGHGSFVVNQDGSITFTPWHGLTGNVSARYRIIDTDGATADGRLSVVVTAGGYRDELETFQDVDASVDVLANDVPGHNADGTPGVLDRTSVRFSAANTQFDSDRTVSTDGRTLTDPTFGVLTIAASTGVVTFDPNPAYVSTCCWTDIYYEAQDSAIGADGTTQHHPLFATLIFLVQPNRPLVTNSFVTTPFDASVLMAGVTDDKPSNPRLPLLPGKAYFDIDRANLQPGSTLSQDRRTFFWTGYGRWVVNPDGSVLYTPVPGFVGHIWLDLTVVDAGGNSDTDYLDIKVQAGPTGKPDTATIAQNVPTPIDVLGNDVPGKNADTKPGSMDPTFVRFPTDGQPAGATVSNYARTLTVPDEGVYTADRVTGAVSFDPEPSFVGRASPVTYSARDSVTRRSDQPYGVVHNPVSSTLTVTVTAITPVALNNWATTHFGQPVDIAVLANDRGGASSAPLDPTSVRLRTTAGLPTGSTLGAGAKALTIPGRGAFTARADGVVVFTPTPGFTGRVPTIGYSVANANQTRTAPATITVDVDGAAVMRPTRATSRVGETLVVNVLSNDDPPYGAGWDRSSVCLLIGGGCVKFASADGATWSVDDQGAIVFRPPSTFGGSTQVTYRVHDTVVGTYTSTLTITVLPARTARGD